MAEQLHKRRTTEQVRDILDKHQNKEITGVEAANYLGISRRRLYQLQSEYREQGSIFTVGYGRQKPTRTISTSVKKHILKELKIEKTKIIENPDVPTDRYNYSYIQKQLQQKYGEKVSLPTIISRAKQNGYWKKKPPRQIHDRQVLTKYTGELIQHDASHHRFAPLMNDKLCLTTSLDDFSRAILYADFWEQETTWNHINAAQELVVSHGVPLKYYVDQLAVFRYVKSRDKNRPWNEFNKLTDDVDPQWKQVVKEIGIEPVYALSPQAKGKIERPYRWLQDHIVRTCMREGVTTIDQAREVLKQEINDYNWKRVHSTTGEVPMRRLEQAVTDGKSLWREYQTPEPFTDVRDIFALRISRTVDAYRKVSINNLKLEVASVPPRQEVELRLSPDIKKQIVNIRIWFKGHRTNWHTVKLQELSTVKF